MCRWLCCYNFSRERLATTAKGCVEASIEIGAYGFAEAVEIFSGRRQELMGDVIATGEILHLKYSEQALQTFNLLSCM